MSDMEILANALSQYKSRPIFCDRGDSQINCALDFAPDSAPYSPDVLYYVGDQYLGTALESDGADNLLCRSAAYAQCPESASKKSIIFIDGDLNDPLLRDSVEEQLAALRSIRFAGLSAKMMEALSNSFKDVLGVIADIAEELMGNPVVFSDTGFKVIARSRSLDLAKGEFSEKLDAAVISTLSTGFLSKDSLDFVNRSGRLKKLQRTSEPIIMRQKDYLAFGKTQIGYGSIDCAVRIRGLPIAMLSVVGIKRPFNEYDIENVKFVARSASVALQQIEPFSENDEISFESVLFDILAKKLTDRSVIQLRLRLLNKTLKQRLCVVAVMDKNHPGETPMDNVRQSLVRALFPNSLSLKHKNAIIVLANCDEGRPMMTHEDELTNFLKLNQLCAGMSEEFTNIEEMLAYYNQAVKTVELGLLLYPDDFIYSYCDYFIFRAIEAGCDRIDQADLVDPGIKKLYHSESEGSKQLLTTLYLYLFSAKNVSLVTRLLHIHKSTLFYRLNRAQELMGVDLSSGETLFRLMYSFKIIEFSAAQPGTRPQSWLKTAISLLNAEKGNAV